MAKQQLNPAQSNISGTSWTPTLVGFSTPPTGVYRYSLVGKMCTIFVKQSTNGTSNSTAFTISLPFPAATVSGMSWDTVIQTVNNGTSGIGWASISSGGTVVNLYSDAGGSGWAASGNKRTLAMQITYEVA